MRFRSAGNGRPSKLFGNRPLSALRIQDSPAYQQSVFLRKHGVFPPEEADVAVRNVCRWDLRLRMLEPNRRRKWLQDSMNRVRRIRATLLHWDDKDTSPRI